MKHYVTINSKQYKVVQHDNGVISISTTWEAIVPSTARSAHPSYSHRYASIDPSGRLGKKILASLEISHAI
jgi:hypothetical protein